MGGGNSAQDGPQLAWPYLAAGELKSLLRHETQSLEAWTPKAKRGVVAAGRQTGAVYAAVPGRSPITARDAP